MKFKHFIITRYNLGLYATKAVKDKEAWMADRLRLFSTYCLPSVKAQYYRNFVWVILVDHDTPVSDYQDIENIVPNDAVLLFNQWENVGRFDEKNCEQRDWKAKFVTLCETLGCEYAAMTRLDNDDALCTGFVGETRKMLETIRKLDDAIIDANCGMFYEEQTGKTYVIDHPYGSPFITYCHKVQGNMNTVYNRCHRDVAISTTNRHYIQSRFPMWVEVIHDNNKSNRVIKEMIVSESHWPECRRHFGI